MLINKIHINNATSLSLNERFSILQSVGPIVRMQRPRPISSSPADLLNRPVVELLALQANVRAALTAKRRAFLKQRVGVPRSRLVNTQLRRFGSEGNIAGGNNRFRSRSASNSARNNVKSRLYRSGSVGSYSRNGLSRSGSLSNISQASSTSRGGTGRGRRRMMRRLGGNTTQRGQPGNRGNFNMQQNMNNNAVMRGQRGRGRGRGRGLQRGTMRKTGMQNQDKKPTPSKEELDNELDKYMAGSKAQLDKELEVYMSNVMDTEE